MWTGLNNHNGGVVIPEPERSRRFCAPPGGTRFPGTLHRTTKGGEIWGRASTIADVCKYTRKTRNNTVRIAASPSMIKPSGACTVANTSDKLVGVVNAPQLTAANTALAPKTSSNSNVRKCLSSPYRKKSLDQSYQ